MADGDEEKYREAIKRSERVVEHQLDTIDDIDEKALKILRVNMILVGLVLTGISVAITSMDNFDTLADTAGNASVNTTGSISNNDGRGGLLVGFLNPYTAVGLTSLILSIVTAGLTYTASDSYAGINARRLSKPMIEYTEVQLYEELLTEYDEIIEFNKETNIRNTPLITITILLVMTAVTFLSLGVLYMLWSPRYVFYLFWLVVGLLAVAGWRSGLISQLKQRVELWAQE